MREKGDERVEEALDVEETDGLGVESQLLPRQHLEVGRSGQAVEFLNPPSVTVRPHPRPATT